MIYTITLNPALDYYMVVDKPLIDDEVNRSIREEYKAGGKGLNVSKVLSLYGYHSKALALIGGFTGEYIKDYYTKISTIDFIPIYVEGITRINVKILGENTAICVNGNGVKANKGVEDTILNLLDCVSSDDYVMICGKIAEGLTDSIVRRIADKINLVGAKLVIDMESINRKIIEHCKPYLIKPNLYELGIIMEKQKIDMNNLHENVNSLLNYGLKTILVSLGKDGAYYSDGIKEIWVTQPAINPINKVGCGDAMLGSFIGKKSVGESIEECLKYAVAAGCATACKVEDITLSDIERLYSKINVE